MTLLHLAHIHQVWRWRENIKLMIISDKLFKETLHLPYCETFGIKLGKLDESTRKLTPYSFFAVIIAITLENINLLQESLHTVASFNFKNFYFDLLQLQLQKYYFNWNSNHTQVF